MSRGGKRDGAGRPPGSGTGKTVEVRSVSMLPEAWAKLDQMRGTASRGIWISAAVYQRFNASHQVGLTPPV
jgi:hypothetical protein